MQSKPNDWYKHCWTLDIQNQSWTESTVQQVDFLIEKLNLSGNERILDLACGFGRHALEFARRRESAAGENIAPADIGYAQKECVCGEIVGANGLLRRTRVTERRSAAGSSGENITTIAASGSGQSGK